MKCSICNEEVKPYNSIKCKTCKLLVVHVDCIKTNTRGRPLKSWECAACRDAQDKDNSDQSEGGDDQKVTLVIKYFNYWSF